MWVTKSLKELIEGPITGEWGTEPENDQIGIRVLRTTNFTNEGLLNLDSGIAIRSIAPKKVEKKTLKPGDIIIEKSGGSPTQPVGRVVYFDQDGTFLTNNFTSILRPRKNILPKYLFYQLFNHHRFGTTLKYQNKTTGIINLKLNNYIEEIQIPLPPLPVQRRIAAILDAADEHRRKTEALIEKYDELAQSVFLEMFGDPVRNEKGWEVIKLGKIAQSIKYGTNQKSDYSKNDSSVPVIRIPNVMSEYVSFDDLKYADLEENELSKTELINGDILFVRSNGNPNYIGRCAVYESEIQCVFASYLIRVRLIENTPILPKIIVKSMSSHSYRDLILKIARTTAGNYNMNTQGLKELELFLPPLSRQIEYLRISTNIEKQKSIVQENFKYSETLFQSLLQRAFRGELVTEEELID